MSLIVAVYVPTGIALSGDSRTTGTITQQAVQAGGPTAGQPVSVQTQIVISDAAEKVSIAFGRFLVGTFGDALVNKLPIAHYVKQFELDSPEPVDTKACADSLLGYFSGLQPKPNAGFLVCGYDANIPHVFGVDTAAGAVTRMNVDASDPAKVTYGIARGGDSAVVNRLLSDPQFNPIFDAMNLQDAVDYSRHLIRSTIDQMRFEPRFPTVGGTIDTAVATPDGGPEFLARKELGC